MKYTIMATHEQLKQIGIDADISGMTGKLIKNFPDGYCLIEINHILYDSLKITTRYDIPKLLLKEYNS